MYRLPVIFNGKPLMPMKASRVQKFIDLGKGKIKYDRKLKIHYLQLLVEPSGVKTQEIVLGFDPGSTYDGVSVVSAKCHHVNIELEHRPKKGKTSIKSFKERQRSNRRIRRNRLKHRPTRFDNRTTKKLSPTIKANVDFRKWLIKKLIKIYPISKIVIEDVKFNHYKNKNGRAFSIVEQGKNVLYDYIKELGIELETYDGYNTKKLRINSFGSDPKDGDKSNKCFYTHCIDSFVLACKKYWIFNKETGEIDIEQPIITNDLEINRKVIFIEKIVKIRRCLYRIRKKYNDAKDYYILLKGGIKKAIVKYGKTNICRVKPEKEHSNHPKKWTYIVNEKVQRFKCNKTPYGGTRVNGKTFFMNNEWQNRTICVH